jgi:hypothetical protein
MLEEHDADVLGTFGDAGASSTDAVTDRLLGDRQEVTCWTCGTAVERDQ